MLLILSALAPLLAPAQTQAAQTPGAQSQGLDLPEGAHAAFDSSGSDAWTDLVSRIAADRRIIGLGECSHYTKECYDLKSSAILRLASEGFDGLVLEVDFGQALAWNRYVCAGEGDPDELIRRSGWFTYRTEEFKELLMALRAHNAASPEDEAPFQIFGMEMTAVGSGRRWMADAAQASEAFSDDAGRDWIAALRAERKEVAFQPHSTAEQTDAWDLFHRSQALFGERRAAFAASAGERSARDLERIVETLRQYATYVSQDDFSLKVELRDQFSSRNVLWCLDTAGEAAQLVLWAHNGHVGRRPPQASYAVVGSHLARWFGDDYAAVGFTFNEGEVGTFGTDGFYYQRFERAADSTFTGRIGAMGSPFVAIDIATALSKGGDSADWLRAPQAVRTDLGESFRPTAPRLMQLAPAPCYDVLVYIDRATRPGRLEWIR